MNHHNPAARADENADRLIGTEEVIRLIGMSRTWLFAQIKQGNFLQPIRIGLRSNKWRRSEVLEFLEQKRVTPR